MAADFRGCVARHLQRRGLVEDIDLDGDRGQHLGEADALLHRLCDLLMVEGVARRIDEAPAIGDGHPAPGIDEAGEARRPALAPGRLALVADRAGVGDELLGDLALGAVPCRAHRFGAALGDQGLVAVEEFLDLHRVIGERLGRGIDRGEAAADHHDRQAHGQIGDAVRLGRAGQLQRHQEIGSLAHPGDEAVVHRDHGRTAGPGAQRDMVEAEGKRAGNRQRAAKAHPAIHRKPGAALQEEADQFEEILVPAHRDAVFGDPAEPGHHALVEPLVEARDIAHGIERDAPASERDAGNLRGQWLDLQPVDRGDEMPVVDQMVRQVEPGGTEPDHQHLVARWRPGQGAAQVERVPPGEEAVDFEAPRQAQYVLQGAGLDLRDVDRVLPLVDAGFHAVVADAVPGGGAERVVDRDDGERAH